MKQLKRFKGHTDIGSVDKDKGIIFGVSVITGNREATGHQEFIDEKTVDQVIKFGKETGDTGLKARFDHPNACGRSMGTAVGRFKNFRKDGLQARADLHLLDSATTTPDGDLRTHLLDLAQEDSEIFATSIVFRPDHENMNAPNPEDHPDRDESDPFMFPHTRIASLHACDVVDEAAANDGLFGNPAYMAEQAEHWANEHPEIIESILKSFFNNNKNLKFMSTKKKETQTTEETTGKVEEAKVGDNTTVETSTEEGTTENKEEGLSKGLSDVVTKYLKPAADYIQGKANEDKLQAKIDEAVQKAGVDFSAQLADVKKAHEAELEAATAETNKLKAQPSAPAATPDPSLDGEKGVLSSRDEAENGFQELFGKRSRINNLNRKAVEKTETKKETSE